ncbi:MAG: signal peptidase I [Candidatus Riflebacteria bacterium]|nr:signal peptidase I [Candidatus Riflebacteria bacterium]
MNSPVKPESSSIRIKNLTVRYGKGPVTQIEQIPPDEVFSEPVVWLSGQVSGKLPENVRLELSHFPKGRRIDKKALPVDRGRFAATIELLNGINDITIRLYDQADSLISERAFTLIYKSAFREWNETVFIAFVLALLIRSLVLQAFWIPTGSMEPTLLGEKRDPMSNHLERSGDRILVNKFAYLADFTLDGRLPFLPKIWFGLPKRGDIVVFLYPDKDPKNPKRDFIKRVIGLPGDEIKVVDGVTSVNGTPLEEPYIAQPPYQDYETIVPSDSLFCMGDNRNNSADSRTWGPMPLKNLKGQAVFLYWPLARIRPIRSYEHPPIPSKNITASSTTDDSLKR